MTMVKVVSEKVTRKKPHFFLYDIAITMVITIPEKANKNPF